MMSAGSYLGLVEKHLSDCKKYGISLEDATFEIMHMAEDYADEEVKLTFSSLPSDVLDLAHHKLDVFKQTGEYHVISSIGVSKDMTDLMARLSKLI
ncbi:hypothetical protein K6Y31_21595 [Motilimonas cestriensis]|uniref:Uncharacterized protein n=1 Tax=Motilimonas cestriensis TaxID=2742685 RepID=A0ABS8WEA1_9GAMM|nr:hypothetical protein [Motilimonas cestriensis]MCE2597369.1 hypothetical protein [Motilimonas cestriensis]